MRRSFRLTYSITKPISEILHNIKKVGKGEYKTINVVSADSVEIQELDAGTRKMAGRIEGLLENVRKEQEVQHMTELQLIQAQVNPHFLYNTLDTIVWLVEGGMQQDAVDMITSLSVFFRTSLSKGKDIIPLSEEKRHTLSYLEIQQFRYRDILEFELSIPKELDGIQVPKLSIQPLAENALYHGITFLIALKCLSLSLRWRDRWGTLVLTRRHGGRPRRSSSALSLRRQLARF